MLLTMAAFAPTFIIYCICNPNISNVATSKWTWSESPHFCFQLNPCHTTQSDSLQGHFPQTISLHTKNQMFLLERRQGCCFKKNQTKPNRGHGVFVMTVSSSIPSVHLLPLFRGHVAVQQSEQGCPDIPLPGHFLHFHLDFFLSSPVAMTDRHDDYRTSTAPIHLWVSRSVFHSLMKKTPMYLYSFSRGRSSQEATHLFLFDNLALGFRVADSNPSSLTLGWEPPQWMLQNGDI